MEMVKGHGVILDSRPARRGTALTAVHEFLVSKGVDPLDADEALPRARIERMAYSPTAGFVHDCSGHGPDDGSPEDCHADARVVWIVTGLPPAMTGGEAPRPIRAVRPEGIRADR